MKIYINVESIESETKLMIKMKSPLQRRNLPFLLLLVGNVIYITYWSVFSLDRFYSLHAYILDLGAAMESGWLIFQTQWTLISFFHNFAYLSGRFLLSPLLVTGSFPLVLIVQTVAISSCSVFLFFIATQMTGSRLVSLLIGLSYLIYFPLAGTNFYDFHYQVFFMPFFLAGFYFLLRERYVTSIVLLAISGLTKFPFVAFPAALFFIELFTVLVKGRFQVRSVDRKRLKFLIEGIAVFSAILLLGYLSLMSSNQGASQAALSFVNGSSYSISNIRANLDGKVMIVLLALGSLLFLPLRSKYMVLALPFFFFVFTFGFKGYLFPYVLQDQYSSALVPFLFIALIDSFRKYSFPGATDNLKGDGDELRRRVIKWSKSNAVKEAVVIFLILVLMAQVYQPYGPLNSYTEDSFGSGYVSNVSIPDFSVFEHAMSLIPKDTPANEVFVQNDLPFIYPLPVNSSSPLSSIQTLTYNGTGFFNNFTEIGSDGRFYPISPKYVVMYPYGSYGPKNRFGYFEYINQVSPTPNNLSNFMIVTHLLATSGYGLIAEADGLFILEKGYKGSLEYYVPFNRYYPYSDFLPGNESSVTQNGITIENTTNELFFYGPPTALSPGNYSVTYHFRLMGNNTSGIVNLRASYNNGYQFFSKITSLNKNDTRNGTLNFTYNFSSNLFTADDQFVAKVDILYGSLTFEGIYIHQVWSAPS